LYRAQKKKSWENTVQKITKKKRAGNKVQAVENLHILNKIN